MTKKGLDDLLLALKSIRNCVVVTHKNPDGDAVGSSLGLALLLNKAGHHAKVIVPNTYPDFLDWMPGKELILNYERESAKADALISTAELIFCLDFNALSRIEALGEKVKLATAKKVLVDHHPQPEEFASVVFHDTKASSTAELIYRLADEIGYLDFIDQDSGICIYTGIMTDTASFRFPAVSAYTHQIAGALIQKGVKHYIAHQEVYDTNSNGRLQLLGYALSKKMTVLQSSATAYIVLNEKELQQFDFKKGDTEGLVNYCLSVKGIKLAAFFMEREGGVKVSLRSKGAIDVNRIARNYFNGGGHKNAAGGNPEGSMDEVVNKFLSLLPDLKNEIERG